MNSFNKYYNQPHYRNGEMALLCLPICINKFHWQCDLLFLIGNFLNFLLLRKLIYAFFHSRRHTSCQSIIKTIVLVTGTRDLLCLDAAVIEIICVTGNSILIAFDVSVDPDDDPARPTANSQSCKLAKLASHIGEHSVKSIHGLFRSVNHPVVQTILLSSLLKIIIVPSIVVSSSCLILQWYQTIGQSNGSQPVNGGENLD